MSGPAVSGLAIGADAAGLVLVGTGAGIAVGDSVFFRE